MSPQSTIAHYRIQSKLGEGGMGTVYRATDTKLNRDVAIKVLPDAFAADAGRLGRFTREAQVLASLNHPNIAAIYGVEERSIVLELVEGQTLAGPLSEEEALPLIHQLIDALEYAHEKGIVHRDLKPANIKITPEGRLKVLDFGLAKAMSNDAPEAGDPSLSPTLTMRATLTGVIMGTAAYMSPEQARGHAVDKRADIWAFAVVVHEMLTGRALFQGETVSDTLAAVLRQDPDIAAAPPRFHRLLRLCLMRDPRQRLRDISGARLLLDEPTAASAAPASRPVKWIAATAVMAAISAIALGVAWHATRPIERPLMRLNVDLGPEAVADPRTVFTLSPDARRIVYTARSAGKQVLATRLLHQTKVDIIPGTEGATDPFFSPDGEWLGFFADNKVKKIAVQGGAPVVLSEATSYTRGASWGEDGSIVVTMSPATGLSRISASGGAAQVLTNPYAQGQVTHRWPQFLPGGHAVIFTAHTVSTGLDDASIDALDLKTGKWKTVQRGGFFGRYLPSGHLVYVHKGVLYGVRFDPVRLETRGSPAPLLDDVAANLVAAAGRFDFSAAPSGSGTFGYMTGRPETVPARTVWLDQTGKTQPVSFTGGTIGPALSPDGRMVALAVGGIGSQDIRVWDFTREVLTSITSNAKGNANPVWTPDGRHLVFGSFFNNVSTLWWARADGGGEPRKLVESKAILVPSSFSPDGRRLAYTQPVSGTGEDLWTVPIDISDPENPKAGTPEPFLRTPAADVRPMFSPDGRWIAYASQETGPFEVYVRPFPSGGGRWQISAGDGAFARWSRTGRQIFFTTSDGRIMVTDYEIKGDSFLVGKPRPWTDTRISANMGRASFDLAPGAKRVLTSVNPVDVSQPSGSVHITLLLNFFDELKRRLP
ncbi:MAG TPA: protein kinase [Bryobacteraceae bacterium]|nr:protein kinase [Bryobacteraceae bacterium]